MLLIKSSGGSGTLSHSLFTNFTGHSNAYTLSLDSSWAPQTPAPGWGIEYEYLTFSSFSGTCLDGVRRAPLQLFCPEELLCGNIEVKEFNVWTESGDKVLWKCQNAYGEGGCMNLFAGNGAYTSTKTITAVETG